jgi:tetratricopeptide (TPR) repeat protein
VDKAIKEYEEILKQDDSNPDLWNTLGDLYLRAKNRDKALECYEKSLDLYIKDGYTDNAIAVGKKILRYDPNRHMVHLQLARLYADPDIKNYKGALDEIRRFYETAQEVPIADLNQIMSLLSQIWEPLSSENAAENMPIFDNLFKLTEELIEQISMTGFDTQSTIPLTQVDLGKLEEEFGGPVEQTPVEAEPAESVEPVAEPEPFHGESPTLPEVEESTESEELMAPPDTSEEEEVEPQAPTLSDLESMEEEIEIVEEDSPSIRLEEEPVLKEPSSPEPAAVEEEPEELRILEQAAAEESLNLEEEVLDIPQETAPAEVSAPSPQAESEQAPALHTPETPTEPEEQKRKVEPEPEQVPSPVETSRKLVELLKEIRVWAPETPPSYPVDYEEAGYFLTRMGLQEPALFAYTYALEHTPHPGRVYARMGQLLRQLGQPRLALRALEKALSREEDLSIHDQAQVYATLSRVYRAMGEEAKAEEAWEEACLRDPELWQKPGGKG